MKSKGSWTLLITLGVAAWMASPFAQTQRPPQRSQAGQAPSAGSQMPKRFSGQPIDVDYASADLRKVLRQVADVGGINLAIDPSVSLTSVVDLKLTQVPWDQVLDTVMSLNGLTNIVDGTVVIVMTRDARTKMLKDEADEKKAAEVAPNLRTERVRLNFAKAADVKKLVEKGLTPRGNVDADDRANMVIIKDTDATIEDLKALIADLDKPEPQVEISAKIVQTNHDTARELGMQWGLSAKAAPAYSNTTGIAFPNNGSITGATASGKAVDLGAVGATSAATLALGSVNGAVNLDVTLSALEHKGVLEILSQPKVQTANNKQAEMASGFQIPYQTVSNNTTIVQFKDAALKLLVTPHISSTNAVIMEITLENATPDFSKAVNGNPSINTQRAVTEVQVDDGQTTVIGGIVQSQKTQAKDTTPGLSRVPLIGWMFKHTADKSQSQDLVIFITPRIVR